MRRLWVWGLRGALCLALGVGSAAAAGEPADGKDAAGPAASSGGWFNVGRWFGFAKKAPERPSRGGAERKAKPEGGEAAKASGGAGRRSAVVEEAATARALEEAAWQRRAAVCDKLREIAVQANDPELERLAEELDGRAWEVYLQRTQQLPAARAKVDLDEQILNKHQPERGDAPRGGELMHSVSGQPPKAQAARGEKP
jgi:hypothetical protein